ALYVRQRPGEHEGRSTQEWFRFQTATDFWAWVESHTFAKCKTWIFAHNWNFDGSILRTGATLTGSDWQLTTYINDKPPVIIRWRKDGRTIQLIDSLNYFLGSLEYIGESIGISKLEMPHTDATPEDWDTYCKRDVEVLYQAIIGFRKAVKDLDLGNFQMTLASQAFTAYRHRFMDQQILIHDKFAVCKMEREGYYGGRTESFYLGTINASVYSLDFNSMYPAVMQKEDYPVKLFRVFKNVTLGNLVQLLETYCVVAEVLIDTDQPIYPKRINKRLCFPVGSWWGVLTTPELQYALRMGHIKETRLVSVYTKANLFRDYVTELYALRMDYRRDKNPVFEYVVKILLNSLYGKFGQNGQKWEDTEHTVEDSGGIIIEENPDTGQLSKYRVRLGKTQEFSRDGESENSFPGLAAHVTAYGRMMLWDAIQQAGEKNVYYTDTDSLIVNETGRRNLEALTDADRLGALKVEHSANNVTIWGAKDYRFGDTEKHKGIKKSANKLSNDTWEQDQFTSWDAQLAGGTEGFIPIRRITKTLHRTYRKGRRTDSGWVMPLRENV
ncbi:hypothetical protein LCGC14_1833250, partial [marine sediment metagenome]